MDIQFMKDYYDLRYEETDGENHFVEETAYQEKQSEQSKMENISARMPMMKNFCFPNSSMSISREEPRHTM
jgi:hypothetical protein